MPQIYTSYSFKYTLREM